MILILPEIWFRQLLNNWNFNKILNISGNIDRLKWQTTFWKRQDSEDFGFWKFYLIQWIIRFFLLFIFGKLFKMWIVDSRASLKLWLINWLLSSCFNKSQGENFNLFKISFNCFFLLEKVLIFRKSAKLYIFIVLGTQLRVAFP